MIEESGLVKSLGEYLEKVCSSNTEYEASRYTESEKRAVTSFHARKVPSISVPDYFSRLVEYSYCSPECFSIALMYLEKIAKKTLVRKTLANPLLATRLTVHRLLIGALLVAIKARDDVYYYNDYYARVGGISTPELNKLEIDFLQLIDFELYVKPVEFNNFKSKVLYQTQLPSLQKLHFAPSHEEKQIVAAN